MTPWEEAAQPQKASTPWEEAAKAPAASGAETTPWQEADQTTLFSAKGLGALARSIPRGISEWVLGNQLAGHEDIVASAEKGLRVNGRLPLGVTPADVENSRQKAAEYRSRLEALRSEEQEQMGGASYPLQIASGVAQSVASNAPGIAAGVLAAPTVGASVASLPGLMLAGESAAGQSYAQDRVPNKPGQVAASVEEALTNMRVKGLVEAGFEGLPLGKLLEEVGSTGVRELIKRYILREYATEIPTTIAQDLSDWSTVQKDKPLGQFVKETWSDVVDTALTVPFSAGMSGAGAHLQRRAADALKPVDTYEGPSGERLPLAGASSPIMANTPSLDPNLTPAQQATPRGPTPVPSRPITPDVQALIDAIDQELGDPNAFTPEQVAQAKQTVADFEKQRTATPPNPQTQAQLSGLNELNKEDLAELGESGKVARNAKQYANENDLFERTEREVLFSPADHANGSKLDQVELQPGVYTVGTPTEDRSQATLRAYHDTISQWQAKFLPGSTILLMNESLPTDSAVGWHTRLDSGVHVIVPAALRSFSSSDTFNTNAQGKVFYNLAHEFGHALIEDRFFEGVPAATANSIRAAAKLGPIPEDLIAKLPPAQQAVLSEFNAIKAEVLSGTMTAGQFQTRWMGPAKVHKFSLASEHYVPPDAPAMQLVDAIIGRAARNLTTLAPQSVARLRNEYLGLDEYLAEQMSRYAYAKKLDVAAPKTMQELIGSALSKVRSTLVQFFKTLKDQGVLAPGTAFQDWVDSLSKKNKGKPVKASKPKAVKPAETKPKAVKKVPVEKKVEVAPAEHNVETAPVKRQKVARAALVGLVKEGVLETGSAEYKEMMALVKAEDFSTFTDMIQPYIEKKVRFEIDSDLAEYTDAPQGFKPIAAENLRDDIISMMQSLHPTLPQEEFLQVAQAMYKIVQAVDGMEFLSGAVKIEIPLVKQSILINNYFDALDALNTLWDYYFAKVKAAKKKSLVADGGNHAALPVVNELVPPEHDLVLIDDIKHFLDKVPSDNEAIVPLLNAFDEAFMTGNWDNVYVGFTTWKPNTAHKLLQELWKQFAKEAGYSPSNKVPVSAKSPAPQPKTKPLAPNVPSNPALFGISEEEARKPAVLADAAREWKEKGFASKYFKVWFGDWQNDPQNAGKFLDIDGRPLVLYHATPHFFWEFNRGDIGFHFGTPRAAHNRVWGFTPSASLAAIHEKMLDDPEHFLRWSDSTQILPVVLNVRNPWIAPPRAQVETWVSASSSVGLAYTAGVFDRETFERISEETQARGYSSSYEQFAPLRQWFIDQGYDGIQYHNPIEGDISYVAFYPDQVKSVLGTKTFSQSRQINFELDFDESQPASANAGRFYRKISPFFKDKGPLRRSLRWVANLKYKGLQLQQMAHLYPWLADLNFMREANNNYERFKSFLMERANGIAERWHNMGKENTGKIKKVLDEQMAGGELWPELVQDQNGQWIYQASERFHDELKKRGIDVTSQRGQDLAAFILEIQNSLLDHVNQAHAILKELTARRYGNAQPQVLRAALTNLAHEIHELRKRPFVPQGRFGNWIITIEKKKDDGTRGWETVHRQAFESEDEWEKTYHAMAARTQGDERIRKHKLTDAEYVLMSLPQDFIETAASELSLSDEQVEHLLDILQPIRKQKALSVYDQERLMVKGASEDTLRSYSNFMWHNSNLLAKMRYRADFNLAIRGIRAQLRRATYAADGPFVVNTLEGSHTYKTSVEAVKHLGEVARYMENTRDAILYPANEAHLLRSAVALLYLALNIKTAVMNLTGLVTTWSDITTRMGLVKGEKLMTEATWYALRSINPFNLNTRLKGEYMKPIWLRALDQAISEGQLTQSYAYHLAGMANQGTLHRMPGRDLFGRYTRYGIDLAMWVFRLTELSTRRVTFLAQFESELQKGLAYNEAYNNAIASTNKLQNDYSQGNRAPFLRGNKIHSGVFKGNPYIEGALPAMTVFMSFAQHMTFHAFGGYEAGLRRRQQMAGRSPRLVLGGYTMKIWILLLVLAGYEGLPLVENMLDILDAFFKKWHGKPLRQELRELVQAVGADPELMAHGLGHNIAGFDVSRSIGLGRIVPGTDVVSRSSDGDMRSMVGNLALNLAGPLGGVIDWALTTAWGKRGFREGLTKAPGAIGNIASAYEWSRLGVRAPSGALITKDPKTGEPRDLTTTEIYGKALGFNPTIVSQNRERIFTQHDAQMYWKGRRDMLLADVWKAYWQDDREAMADARKAVEDYNTSLPEEYAKDLQVTNKQISASIKARRKAMKLEEEGLPRQKRYRSLYQDIKESFEAP